MPDVTGEVNFPEATEALKVIAEEMRALRVLFTNVNASLEYTNELLGKVARNTL